MRLLVIMVGIQASGKSSVAREFAELTGGATVLSLDAFRNLMCPTHLATDGERVMLAGYGNTKEVFHAYESALRTHINAGTTLVLDNTHLKAADTKNLVHNAKNHGYSVLYAIMGPPDSISIQTWADICVQRDLERHGIKHVGKDVIYKAQQRQTNLRLKNAPCIYLDGTMPPRKNAEKLLDIILTDQTFAKHIVPTHVKAPAIVIGDVHACNEKLEKLSRKAIKANIPSLVFVGDLLDRGDDPCGTIRTMMHLDTITKCTFIEGNHDSDLRHCLTAPSDRPNLTQTMQSIETIQSAPDAQELENWLRTRYIPQLVPCVIVDNPEATLFVTHGGVTCDLADEIVETNRIPACCTTYDFIFGCGTRQKLYQQSKPAVYDAKDMRPAISGKKTRQAYGHRTTVPDGHPHVEKETYLLESQVEHGGCLSAVVSDVHGLRLMTA